MSNFINVDKLYYAICSQDNASGAVYGTPKVFAPVAKINVDPSSDKAAFYADGVIQEHSQILSEGKIQVAVSALSLTTQADIFGHSLDGAGGIVYNKDDKAPYVAILYRRKKANGKYRYIRLFKCLFQDPKSDDESNTDKGKPQGDTIEGTFMTRIYDGSWRYSVDEEEVNYVDISSTFFTTVGTSDVTPPTISSTTPTAGATAVSVNTTFAWVFSEPLAPGTVGTNNFFLIKDSDGSIVAATLAYNSATRTVTLTPSSALSATSKYLAVSTADITDLAGNHLVPVTKIFTTA